MVRKNPRSSRHAGLMEKHPEIEPTSPENPSSQHRGDSPSFPIKEQQRLLNIFSDAFDTTLRQDNFPALLQEIKRALYERDFAAAFGREERLAAYAARWSPTRALCYADVLHGIEGHMNGLIEDLNNTWKASESRQITSQLHSQRDIGSGENGIAGLDGTESHPESNCTSEAATTVHVFSIGGCAAEHGALASYISRHSHGASLTLLDRGPWGHIVECIQDQLVKAPKLSKYASAAVIAANKPLLNPTSHFAVRFLQQDILACEEDELSRIIGSEPVLVTVMFTLNELYSDTGGIGKATRFLRILEDVLAHGSLLLVVDSPGSYSEAAVGKDTDGQPNKTKKKYPMQWLLHHTLTDPRTHPVEAWERLESDDSVWFRLSPELKYPIQLENMRYQMHLYRRIRQMQP